MGKSTTIFLYFRLLHNKYYRKLLYYRDYYINLPMN